MTRKSKNTDPKNRKTERQAAMEKAIFLSQLSGTLSEIDCNASLFASEARFKNIKTFFQTQINKKSIQFSFIIVQED